MIGVLPSRHAVAGAATAKRTATLFLRKRSLSHVKEFSFWTGSPLSIRGERYQHRVPRLLPRLSSTATSTDRPKRSSSTEASFKVIKVTFQEDGEPPKLQKLNYTTHELLKEGSILARDLFLLNLTSRQERHGITVPRRTIPAIVPRENCTIISYGTVRAVAKVDSILLLDAHNPAVQQFAQELGPLYTRAQAGSLSNELLFLEHVLSDTVDSFHRRMKLYEPIVDSFMDKVASRVFDDTTTSGAHLLVPLKDSLQSFEIQVQQSLKCLSDLLNSDEEMLELLLSEQAHADATNTTVALDRHEHVEVLLGVYARQMSNTLYEIRFLLNRLQSKQEFVTLALAGHRNRMVRMEVHLGIAGLSLGLGTTVAGFFGMNLLSGLETTPNVFYTVIGMSTVSGLAIAFGLLQYLNGRTMQQQAEKRLQEIETLTAALSDMCALDYTIKTALDDKVGAEKAMPKEEFRRLLRSARQSKAISSREVDLLFGIFDKVKDGYITRHDFQQLVQGGWGRSSSKGGEDSIQR